MKKVFSFEYETKGDPRSFSFQYSQNEDEVMSASIEGGVSSLYLNRSALLTLGKIMIQLAEGPYEAGYHLHFNQNFNADQKEQLVVYRIPDVAEGGV